MNDEHFLMEKARGRREARQAISDGAPRYYFQTRCRWGELLTKLIRERFNVEVVHTSCPNTAAERAFEQGFNKETSQHVDREFGRGAFQKVLDEVSNFREQHYRPYLESRE